MPDAPQSRRLAGTLASLAGALAFMVGATPASSAEHAPSVRLLAASSEVTANRGNGFTIDPGVFVVAAGGDFELRASRSSYTSPVSFNQVDSRTGAVLRRLPSRLVRGWLGLRRFARVTVRNRRGRVVASSQLTFCPNGERQRVNGDGPVSSRYPGGCGGGFPFTRGVVWGIDDGWAASVFSADPFDEPDSLERESVGWSVGPPELRSEPPSSEDHGISPRRLPSGRYVLTVRIAGVYAKLFDVPAAAARVRVAVTVTRPPRRRRGAARAAIGSSAHRPGLAADGTKPDPTVLPDLVALPGYGIRLSNRRGRSVLAFNTTSWNAGPGPLVVEGFRRAGRSVMAAYQYFHDAGGQPVGRVPVGTMRYHGAGGHDHWHFLQFARYSLLDGSRRRRLRGRKQSFCLVSTDAVDLTVPRAEWSQTPEELSSACGEASSIWIREMLPTGWGDTYGADLQGQSFDVTGLPNGRYYLQIRVNPLGGLREQTTANNVATRKIRLRGKRGKRRVVVYPWHGIRK